MSALLYVVLGRRPLVWGGHPAITPMVWAVAEGLDLDYGAWVTLYQSRYFKEEFPEDNDRFGNVTFTDAVAGRRGESLLHMRERMFGDRAFAAAVFVGGMDGVLEEFEMFRRMQPQAAVIPVLSTGGAALALGARLPPPARDLSDDLDYVALMHRYLAVTPKEDRFQRPNDQPDEPELRLWKPG